jgi:hypothetical protein
MFVFRLKRDEEEVTNMVKKVEIAAKYIIELKEKIQNTVMTKGVIEG